MRFITDLGYSPVAVPDNGDEPLSLGRYGVWDSEERGKPQVIDLGDDLEALQAEYGPDLPVFETKLPGSAP